MAPSWCGVGGHFEKDELNDAKSAALRELNEEIGLKESDFDSMSLRYATLRCKNDEIRLNFYFFARLRDNVVVRNCCDEGCLEWVALNCVLDREMPYTAKHVLRHYLRIGRNTDNIYCGAAHKDGVSFAVLEEF